MREKVEHTMCPLLVFCRGNSDPFYLSDNQGHCDRVLSKNTFFKAFKFCGLKPFYKDHL